MRTLRDRLLVAQTMVLSRLWHYTQHVSIPETIVKRWQPMLNKFVLRRKHDRHASHVQLIYQLLQTILLPVLADLQYCLAFRILPARSRFWFLKKSNPHICLCVHVGCGAIETEKHLLFDCTLAVQL